jgi:hypothetical protein
VAAASIVAVLVAVRIATADDHGHTTSPPKTSPRSTQGGRAPASANPRAKRLARASDILLLPADGTRTLISVPGLGRFKARCPKSDRIVTSFSSKSGQAVAVVVDDGQSRARHAFVNPGKTLRLGDLARSTTLQHWQLAEISEAFSSVAVVSIASSPARAIGNPGCAVSAYVLGPTQLGR